MEEGKASPSHATTVNIHWLLYKWISVIGDTGYDLFESIVIRTLHTAGSNTMESCCVPRCASYTINCGTPQTHSCWHKGVIMLGNSADVCACFKIAYLSINWCSVEGDCKHDPSGTYLMYVSHRYKNELRKAI